jgi:ribosomal protein L20
MRLSRQACSFNSAFRLPRRARQLLWRERSRRFIGRNRRDRVQRLCWTSRNPAPCAAPRCTLSMASCGLTYSQVELWRKRCSHFF